MVASDARPVIGVIGLGRMGVPICARLVASGLRVVATDRNRDLREASLRSGARWASSVSEVAQAAGIVLTVLPGTEEARQVIGPLLGSLRAGAAWIDMTSAAPSLAQEIATTAGGGIAILECPVGGDPERARAGRLLGYVGGSPRDRAAHRWILELLCEEIVHSGPAGTGYAVKLLVNLLWFGQAVAVAEALALASRLGLDPEAVRSTIARGPATSRFIQSDARALLRGDDMDTFSLARCVEELAGVVQIAADHRLNLPIAERVTALYAQALAHYGDVDGELLAARLVAERLGVRFDGASG